MQPLPQHIAPAGIVFDQPEIGRYPFVLLALHRLSTSPRFQCLDSTARRVTLDRTAQLTNNLFLAEVAPQMPSEQLMCGVRFVQIGKQLKLDTALSGYMSRWKSEMEKKLAQPLEEQMQKARADVGALPEHWPARRKEQIFELAESIARRRYELNERVKVREKIVAITDRFQKGHLFEQLDAFAELHEILSATSEIDEDIAKGPLMLQSILNMRDGKSDQTLEEMHAQTVTTRKRQERLCQLFRNTEGFSFLPKANAFTRRIDAIREKLLMPREHSVDNPFAECTTAILGAAPVPKTIAEVISECDYSINDALIVVNGDIRRLPPQWRVRLKQEVQQHKEAAPFCINLFGCDLTYAKLKALADELAGTPAVGLDVTGATFNGKATIPLVLLQHIFGKNKLQQVAGLEIRAHSPIIEELATHHTEIGLTEEEHWTLLVEIADEEHQSAAEHGVEWRKAEHKKLMQFLKNAFALWLPPAQ